MNRIPIIVAVGLLVLLAAYGCQGATAATHKPKSKKPPVVRMLPPVGDYPDAPCEDPDVDGGNFYLGPSGDFWECICEYRTFGPPDCAWYNQGPINQDETRRIKAKLHRKSLPWGHVIDTTRWKVIA